MFWCCRHLTRRFLSQPRQQRINRLCDRLGILC
jgi:hypothetical protein